MIRSRLILACISLFVGTNVMAHNHGNHNEANTNNKKQNSQGSYPYGQMPYYGPRYQQAPRYSYPPFMQMMPGYRNTPSMPGFNQMPGYAPMPYYGNQMPPASQGTQQNREPVNSWETNSSTPSVSIQNMAFYPAVIKVKKGSAVTWIQNDRMTHDVVSSDRLFKSQRLRQGQSFTQQFDQPGVYNYYCSLHPSMKGQVIVEE